MLSRHHNDQHSEDSIVIGPVGPQVAGSDTVYVL